MIQSWNINDIMKYTKKLINLTNNIFEKTLFNI